MPATNAISRLLAIPIMLGAAACTSFPDRPVDFAPPALAKRAIKYRWQTIVDEHGVVPDGAIDRALAQSRRASKNGGISPAQWSSVGPANFPCWIWAITIDPRDGNRILVAGASGGVWSTSDGGATWQPVADDTLAHTSIGSLVRDPTNRDILYAGTLNYLMPGRGLLRSNDNGRTWQPLASTAPTYSYALGTWTWLSVNAVAIHPGNGNVLIAATDDSLWKSTDAGRSWVRVSALPAKDVHFDPNNVQNLIAGGKDGDAFVSADGGNSWSHVLIPGAAGRAIMSYAPSVAGRVYASTEDNGGTLYRSNDAGRTWTLAGNPRHGADFTQNVIWVDPGNASNLLVGGLNLYRSTDAGASFQKISSWQKFPSSPHADHHAIVAANDFSTSGHRAIYWGNDGGLYRSVDYLAMDELTGWTWLPHAPSTMFYSGAGRRDSSGRLVIAGGTQDHGTIIYRAAAGPGWGSVVTGDGGTVAFDNANPEGVLYSTYTMAGLQRSPGDGLTWSYICQTLPEAKVADQCPGTGKANFLAPYTQDPNRPRLLVGANSVWVTDDAGSASPTWRAIKTPSTGLYFGESDANFVSALAVAKGDSNLVWVGHNNGEVYFTTNALASAPAWVRVRGLPERMVRRILIDPDAPSTVYVAFGGYSSSNVWRTRDGGSTWQDLSSGLPQAPAHTIARHPSHADRLYVGTDVGVFASVDGGQTWSTASDGPGAYPIQELFWADGTTLGAASLGRGMWIAMVADGAANTPGALSGIFYNPSESGWGIDFTQRGRVIFAAWYTYDTSGNPKWYVASNCAMADASSCSGTVYQVAGPRFLGVPFNTAAVQPSAVGSMSVNFSDNNNATFNYTVNGQSRTVAITRQLFGSGATPAINYTDLWWNPGESGWGLSVTHQASIMFLAWFVYDDSGRPVWYVVTNCAVNASGNGCGGTLYRTVGPPFGPSFNPNAVQVITAGSASLSFSDGNNGVLSYTVNGASGTKTITRQLF